MLMYFCLTLGLAGGCELGLISRLGITLLGFLLIVGVFTKRAQTPFSA